MHQTTVKSQTTSSEAMIIVETKGVKRNKLWWKAICCEGKLRDHSPSEILVKKIRRVKGTMRLKAVLTMTTKPETMTST